MMKKKLIEAVIRHRLEFAAMMRSPLKKNIRKIERIQRSATKIVPSFRNLIYEDR